ncbi:RNA polymerase sigma factor RpoH [Novispirillum itersonii]|uniref:RNA polymerase sigma factor RpoH n=1 Tax=Novispirillum itersonii TaxID=189 RepID=UPI0003827022|nr:RNA polymerase sigma factor RpoH [Novispirillum itersonii]
MSFISALPAFSQDGNLPGYMARIRSYPLLTPEEEMDLATRYAETKDEHLANRLITSHLRLVVKMAMQYRRYGLPMADIIAEGNLGLIKAVQKFEPSRGFRLATYAMWWIRASINEYILNSWSLVKIGTVSTQKRIFYNLRKLKAQLGAYEDGPLRDEQASRIAAILDVRKDDVLAMDARLSGRDSSLNALIGEDGDSERIDLLMDDSPNQEETFVSLQERSRSHTLVHTAMEVLNDREKQIITARRLQDDPATLESLGEHYGLSRERVRQIEVRAMEKLEGKIRELVNREKQGIRRALDTFRKPLQSAFASTNMTPAYG